jgi:hypothetical protein
MIQKMVRIVDDDGTVRMEARRTMTPDEIEERAILNAANTAEAIHRRTYIHLGKSHPEHNGK